jgi:hypothetical protein
MHLKTFSLGIIDLLGIMVPGAVWNLLLFYLHVLHPETFQREISLVSAELNRVYPDYCVLVNSCLFLFGSYIFGYISSLIPLRWFDRMTFFLAFLDSEMTFRQTLKVEWKKKLHPYDFLLGEQNEKLKQLQIDGVELIGQQKHFQMFFICKRFILQHSQTVWLEAERREAELRLINGLFYSALFSTILLLAGMQIILALISLCITLLLALGFRRRRQAEVAFIYGAASMLEKDIQRNKGLHGV